MTESDYKKYIGINCNTITVIKSKVTYIRANLLLFRNEYFFFPDNFYYYDFTKIIYPWENAEQISDAEAQREFKTFWKTEYIEYFDKEELSKFKQFDSLK